LKLLNSPTSPYVRKVRAVAIEKGLSSRLELISATPWPDPTSIATHNPLGKIPVLLCDDGTVLYDSPVICEYLDSLTPDPILIPAAGMARFRILRLQALADGIMNAGVSIILEKRRPPAEQSTAAQARALSAITRAVGALQGELSVSANAVDLGQLAIAVAVGYLEFRFPELEVLAPRYGLQQWWQRISARPSLQTTIPS
jgi:glutathione S-transferase